MEKLVFKRWYGLPGEKHTSEDWNRLVDNANIIAEELDVELPTLVSTSDAGALTLSMARAMEECVSILSEASLLQYTPADWIEGDYVYFESINKWEYGLWYCYRALGGIGRPEDTDTQETLLFRFNNWVVAGDGTFSQTVQSRLAESGANGIIGLTQYQADQAGAWSLLGPFVTAVGNGNVTVKCTGLLVGGKDLELTLLRLGDDVMQHTLNITTSGWSAEGDGTYSKIVAVSGLAADAEGVIGYQAGDLAGAQAGVSAGVIMIGQTAGQITLRASRVPTQAFNLVITAVS